MKCEECGHDLKPVDFKHPVAHPNVCCVCVWSKPEYKDRMANSLVREQSLRAKRLVRPVQKPKAHRPAKEDAHRVVIGGEEYEITITVTIRKR
jgi:hypothetical protein